MQRHERQQGAQLSWCSRLLRGSQRGLSSCRGPCGTPDQVRSSRRAWCGSYATGECWLPHQSGLHSDLLLCLLNVRNRTSALTPAAQSLPRNLLALHVAVINAFHALWMCNAAACALADVLGCCTLHRPGRDTLHIVTVASADTDVKQGWADIATAMKAAIDPCLGLNERQIFTQVCVT